MALHRLARVGLEDYIPKRSDAFAGIGGENYVRVRAGLRAEFGAHPVGDHAAVGL
jgi:hypothetical protein